jgi:PAS domain S-box-containing protein
MMWRESVVITDPAAPRHAKQNTGHSAHWCRCEHASRKGRLNMKRDWPPDRPPDETRPSVCERADAASVRLAALVDCSTDAIIDSTRDGTIISWNRSAVRLLRYSAAEAVGRNMRMLMPAEHLREGDDGRVALEQGRYVDLLRTRRRRKDGTLLHVQLSICPLRDAGGRVAGVSTIMRDISDQVEVEHALRERESGLRRAQKLAKLAHVVTRGDGSFESWFETLPELIGRPAEQLPRTTREWLSIVHPDDRAMFRAKSIEAARTGEHVELHYRLKRGDGSWAYMRQEIEPIDGVLDADGKRRWFNGRLEDSQLIARQIVPMQLLLCASPDYVNSRGTPRSLDDLLHHDCVNLRLASGRVCEWEFKVQGELRKQTPASRVTFNDGELVLQAVLQGQGIAQMAGYQVCGLLRQGKLVCCMPQYAPDDRGHYICFLSRQHLPSRIRVFVDYMTTAIRALELHCASETSMAAIDSQLARTGQAAVTQAVLPVAAHPRTAPGLAHDGSEASP